MIQERLHFLYFICKIIAQAVMQCPDHREVQHWTTSETVIHREVGEIFWKTEVLYHLVPNPVLEISTGLTECQQVLVRKVANNLVGHYGGQLLQRYHHQTLKRARLGKLGMEKV